MAPSTLYKVYYPAARPPAVRTSAGTTSATPARPGRADRRTLAELMGRLGHSTPGAAMRYQHAAADRDAEIARRLSDTRRAANSAVRRPPW